MRSEYLLRPVSNCMYKEFARNTNWVESQTSVHQSTSISRDKPFPKEKSLVRTCPTASPKSNRTSELK